jgi:hypothetical protein
MEDPAVGLKEEDLGWLILTHVDEINIGQVAYSMPNYTRRQEYTSSVTFASKQNLSKTIVLCYQLLVEG